MRYNFADTLADYGFSYYEKLHSPIFLLDEGGAIRKVNEAGRKLLKVAHLDGHQVQELTRSFVKAGHSNGQTEWVRIESGSSQKEFRVIAKYLESSDYLLVELLR